MHHNLFLINISFEPGIWGSEFLRQSLCVTQRRLWCVCVFVLFVRLGCFHEGPFPVGILGNWAQEGGLSFPLLPSALALLTLPRSFPAEGPQLPPPLGTLVREWPGRGKADEVEKSWTRFPCWLVYKQFSGIVYDRAVWRCLSCENLLVSALDCTS